MRSEPYFELKNVFLLFWSIVEPGLREYACINISRFITYHKMTLSVYLLYCCQGPWEKRNSP